MNAELIEALRASNPIEDVVSEHTRLRRSGVQFAGRCPFHADRTASFYVHPGKQVFHCHGCQVGGDVFEFIRLLHNCRFPESVELLAVRAGVRLDGFKPSRELTAKVAAIKAQRKEQTAFEYFCNERIKAVNERCRNLSRAATRAEDYLRASIGADPYIDELAWSALERFTLFDARVEREGLVDLDILRIEWERSRAAA